jgi:hypothetical protein
MQPKRIPRNPYPQRKILELSDLNEDVLFEILLHFVAIDWDGGPFTLMLVCRKWQDIVLSKPRIWTWILVDDSQTDWRERMEVAAYLSRGLPLQIRLRVPFLSETPISHVVCRCEVLFVDSLHSCAYYHSPLRRWKSETIVDNGFFREQNVSAMNDSTMRLLVNDSTMRFLVNVPTNRIKILPGEGRREHFVHSAQMIYDQISNGMSVITLLETAHPFLMTSLVFRHPSRAIFRHVHFEIGEVWALLPTLPHLSHLEIHDNFVNMDRGTVLPRISLRSLLTLTINSPMSHWVFFSFSHDIWLGLLTLLPSLDAPMIEAITLHGSVQRIKAAMMKARTRPSDLTLSISTFDEAEDEPVFSKEWVWQGVRRVTVNLPETPESFSRFKIPDELASTIQSLLALLPKGTSTRFCGGGELDAIACSDAYSTEGLNILYTHSRLLDYSFRANNVTSLAVRTSGGVSYQPHQLYAQWLKSAEHIFLDDDDHGESVHECFLAYLFHVSEPALKSWNSGWMWLHEDICSLQIRRRNFSYLRTLRCNESVANELVRRFDTPCLHSITLVAATNYDMLLNLLPTTLLEHASRLKQLKILGMERIPDWSALFGFLSNFKKLQRTISTINLPGMPHPSILQLLVDALRGGSPVHETAELRQKFDEKSENDQNICYRCFMNGFLCYDRQGCQRFWPGNIVSITKDTVIGHY